MDEVVTPYGKKLNEDAFKDAIIASTRYTSMHRVISGSVMCKGCHQPTNTNAISKQKRMKDPHLEDVSVADPKRMAFLVFTRWLW